jgi:two-component system LytT family response regulator
MNTIIIDDEPLSRLVVREYLASYPHIHIVQECSNGFEGFKAIQEHKPGLIFLDIQMPKLTGFEMLELVDDPPQVIFTTAFDEYAIKAFEAHAIDYLLKPFTKERFDKAMQKCLQTDNQHIPAVLEAATAPAAVGNRIVVKDKGNIRIIPLVQVQYLEAADDYVKIHTEEKVFLKKKTMQFFEDTMPQKEFIRTHRSYFVNAAFITRIDLYEKDTYSIVLKTGGRLPVSKAGYKKLKDELGI